MIIDGYEIFTILDFKKKTLIVTYLVPFKLDKGIEDQLKANWFGYVDDNIPMS